MKNESSDVKQVIPMHKCDDDGMDHPSIVYGPVNRPLPVKNESSDVKQVVHMETHDNDGMDHPSLVYDTVNQPLPMSNQVSDGMDHPSIVYSPHKKLFPTQQVETTLLHASETKSSDMEVDQGKWVAF